MVIIFVIEDELHCESLDGKYKTFEEAVAELKRLEKIPYGQEPNIAPCVSRMTCERNYQIIKYEVADDKHWKELERKSMLNISGKEVKWL